MSREDGNKNGSLLCISRYNSKIAMLSPALFHHSMFPISIIHHAIFYILLTNNHSSHMMQQKKLVSCVRINSWPQKTFVKLCLLIAWTVIYKPLHITKVKLVGWVELVGWVQLVGISWTHLFDDLNLWDELISSENDGKFPTKVGKHVLQSNGKFNFFWRRKKIKKSLLLE